MNKARISSCGKELVGQWFVEVNPVVRFRQRQQMRCQLGIQRSESRRAVVSGCRDLMLEVEIAEKNSCHDLAMV